ncbi:DUF1853 family protein [Halomonas borealis]|uniref:DUF1853 family protein n=1 Tax=Halomonas borealis TaxID=2508710 RepID=UPI00109F9315|nr:DUF1853 family protein [Halomonas borealis]
MPPFRDDLRPWRHPLVRDLAWLLQAPDLVTLDTPGRPDRRCLGLESDAALVDYLAPLDAAPAPLVRYVGSSLEGRMGHYHERLWQFLLETAPQTRLLANNLPVLRERRTLGELDLVYAEAPDPAPVHLEVAIKYYLGLPEGPGRDDDQARWVGPGGLDSLALKRHHLAHHQLPLAQRPVALEALAERLGGPIPRLRQRLAMPGVLFYPWHARLPAPRGATPDHLHGHWLHWRDWPRWCAELPETPRGAWLCKPHWLALPPDEQLTSLSSLTHRLRLHFAHGGAPLQLCLRLGRPASPLWRRVIVVDDAWPHRLPLPPTDD